MPEQKNVWNELVILVYMKELDDYIKISGEVFFTIKNAFPMHLSERYKSSVMP